MLKKIKVLTFIIYIVLSKQAIASDLNLIRDAEIEESLQSIAKTVASHSSLHGDLNIYIVDDKHINAFTPGGNQIFINTGMILKCKSYDMIAAVIAHEIGHMQSGHKISRRMNIENAQVLGAMGILLSIGSIVLTSPNEGVFVGTLSGMDAIQRSMLKFSRDQEIAADVAASTLLAKSKIGYQGVIKVLETLKRYDKIMKDEYLSTHPFAAERIKLFKNKSSEFVLDKKLDFVYKMAKAKTEAYNLPNKGKYELNKLENSKNAEDIYERAIIKYRNYKYNQSLQDISKLIELYPDYAYFYELKAQILFDSKNWLESIRLINKAIILSKNSDLLKIQKALYLLSIYDKNPKQEYLKEAEKDLLSIQGLNDIYYKHYLLARVYGKLDRGYAVDYHLAEMNHAIENKLRAKLHAEKALKTGKLSKQQEIRMKDLME